MSAWNAATVALWIAVAVLCWKVGRLEALVAHLRKQVDR